MDRDVWERAWEVPGTSGLVQTRSSPSGLKIVTNRLRVMASDPYWVNPEFTQTDEIHAVSEIQAFGKVYDPPPAPPAMYWEDIATQGYFHLRTGRIFLCDGQVCADPPGLNISGNLFTFTHPVTPRSGRVIQWNVHSANKSVARGSFTIEMDCPNCFRGGPIDGQIFVEFTIRVEFVPPTEEGETEHYNFQGPFKIVGGSDSYAGIKSHGTMDGTFHDHDFPFPPADAFSDSHLDFVMLGNAKIK